MEKFNLYIPSPQMEKLREEADRTGVSIAEIIRQAISSYLSNQSIIINRE